MLQTHGALAGGQFESVSTMLTNSADKLEELYDKMKKVLTKEQLSIADPVLTKFLENVKEASNMMKDANNIMKDALEKCKPIKF